MHTSQQVGPLQPSTPPFSSSASSFHPSSVDCTDVSSRAKVKQDQVPNFRDQKHDGTDAEFGAAVRKSLLLETQHGDLARDLENIELVAHVSPAVHLSLVWRRKIGEMTVRWQSSLPINKSRRVKERVGVRTLQYKLQYQHDIYMPRPNCMNESRANAMHSNDSAQSSFP